MRHKYETRGIVLARAPAGEAHALLAVLTSELGLLRAQATGLRRSGAKLAAALATFAESDVTVVRGKDLWRIAGAVLVDDRFHRLRPQARERAARIGGLLLRLVAGESRDPRLYDCFTGFLDTLAGGQADEDAAEILAALIILQVSGHADGDLPEGAERFPAELLARISRERAAYVARINEGIAASGL